MKRLAMAAFLLAMLAVPSALAVNPSEMLPDPALEARARTISAQLRCLVCQNESIDDSDADLAHDLRVLVRDRIKAGDSDGAVLQYIVDRYGEFVLLKPVLAVHTVLLWAAAPVLLLVGGITLFVATRRRRAAAGAGGTEGLSDEEAAALERLQTSGSDTVA